MKKKNLVLVTLPSSIPIDYVVSKIVDIYNLYTFIVVNLNKDLHNVVKNNSVRVEYYKPPKNVYDKNLFDQLKDLCESINADAIVSFNETLILPVAQVASALGLRGPGSNTYITRDKFLMREAFSNAGVNSPKYHLVDDLNSLNDALKKLRLPILLKFTRGVCSVGHSIIHEPEQAEQVFNSAYNTIKKEFKNTLIIEKEENTTERPIQFIAEEIINGNAKEWFTNNKFADYLSVEGIVCNKIYYPIAITTRMPTVYPFTEVGNQVPCLIPEALQYKIAGFARKAVDTLNLENCGTHTEIKLGTNHELTIIESSARFGGCMNIPQIEKVFGFNMIGALIYILINGNNTILPTKMFTKSVSGAAGTLSLLPINEKGIPWSRTVKYNPDIDWSNLSSPKTRIHLNSSFLKKGEVIPLYDQTLGMYNSFGQLYLESNNADNLIEDQYKILCNLKSAFREKNR